MSLVSRFREAAGTLFGFPRVQGGVVPNYPEPFLNHPYMLERLAWDYPRAMRRVAVVRACVLRVANDIAQLPVVFETQSGEDWKPLRRTNGNIVDVWQKANPEQTSFELVRDLHAQLKASGNAYLVMEDFGTRRVQELWLMPPQFVQPIVGDHRRPEAYVFIRGGRRESIPAENVIHFKGYNPDFEPVGASDLETAELEYSTRYDVGRLMQAFVRNGGMPAGYWKATTTAGKPIALTEPQVNQMKARLDRLYAGIRNAFRAHIVSDLEFDRAGLTPDEMKLMEIATLSDETICRALGVPPWLVGIKEKASGISDKGGAAKADMRVYWQNTIMPETAMRDAILTEKLAPRFGNGIRVRTDYSTVQDLNESLIANAANAVSLVGKVLTSNEMRASVGKPPRPEPEADRLYLLVTPPDPAKADPGSPPAAKDGAPADEKPARAAERMIDGDTKREERRRAASANLRRYERKLETAFGEMLQRQRDRICTALENRQGRALSKRSIDIDEIVMPDPEDEDAIARILAGLIADRGEEALADLALELEMAFNAQRTSGWIKANAQRVLTQVDETTREAVREVMAQSLSLNESMSQLVERIRALPEFDNARAALIARTESTGAYNYASREAWAQSGVVMKQEWLSARDSAARDTNAEADGQVVNLDETFRVGEDELEYPGDPAGDPSEVCNCRCTTLPVVDESARSRMRFKSYLGRVLAGAHREGVAR